MKNKPKLRLISVFTSLGLAISVSFPVSANAGKPLRVFYVTCLQYDNDGSGSIDSISDSMALSAFHVPSGVARVEFYTVSASVENFRQANKKSNWQNFGSALNTDYSNYSTEVVTSVRAEAFASNGTSKGYTEEICVVAI